MLTEDDYLGLDRRSARAQWESIRRRRWPSAGQRQVDFTPVETLLCLAASVNVDHRRYGGANRDRAEAPVPSLAELFRRPNSSVLAKMANLDGSRTNGAKHEIVVAARLTGAPELALLYRAILAGARDAGIDGAALPDFLGLEDGSDLVLDGQEELHQPELEEAVRQDVRAWRAKRDDVPSAVTERLLVAVARIGQHRFARGVLDNHGHQCVFCGLSVAREGGRAARMLVASHIKPWRISSHAERLDIRNGLAACPTHDVAFDTGLLTVNGGLRIHLEPRLRHVAESDAAAHAAFGRPPLAERLLLPLGAQEPEPRHLSWHNDYVGWFAARNVTG